ncbi:MAG: amino acid adenylation domain-containing protein [Acidobacteriia bacterium]|nr:amino acid adenylation domain-containing protein [Terriglobia bacterium]
MTERQIALVINKNKVGSAPRTSLQTDDSEQLQLTINEIFDEQARLYPRALAIEFESSQLTYQELNDRANQLAWYLHRLGIKEGDRVGICVERSLEMVVGILGILKAGAAYVPLDGNYPQERLSFMAKDAEVQLLLSQQKLAARIPGLGVKRFFLDTGWAEISQQPTQNLTNRITAVHPAYILYTSGSTGRPKGVCICHRNAVRLVRNTNYADFGADQVFLQIASISFDIAAFEIFGALLNGARLMIFPAYAPSGKELGEWLSQHPVTTLLLPSGMFHEAAECDSGRYFQNLRQFISGGDVLSLSLVRKLLRQYPSCRLINAYGPTENGTFSTCAELREMPVDARSVPIGKPIANSTAYVLDQHMQVMPVGEVGELCLGGHGLAHGYWKQPMLTADKFVPDPFSTTPGARLYRSGDHACYLPDGTLEFLGRIDQQVKLRGYRIELGEIEAVLQQHAAVGQAVVLVREDNPGDARLTAYVVKHTGESLSPSGLREYISNKLPEYMVPSAFVLMEKLPLTANGKVDRRALPMPGGERPALEQSYVAPATATEKLLSSILAEVLHINRVGVQDSFFDLGGNSLLAAQVISRVGKTCHVSLPLRSFFDRPVLADLAQYVEAAQRQASSGQAPSIGPVSRGQDIPLGFSQERIWFLHLLDPSSIAYHAQATLQISGPLKVPALERSLTEMVKRHEIFRTTFIEKDGRPIQIIHEPLPASFTIIHLLKNADGSTGETPEKIIQNELAKPFDVSQLPLIRWILISFSEDEHLLVHVEHHFLHDGWSFNVFLGELLELYRAFAADQPSPLLPLRFQFADFALWQREFLHSDEAQAQLSYWKEQLAGSPPISELPTDHPRPNVQTFHGGLLRVPLNAELARSLHLFSNQEDVSLFVVMMSSFFVLAYHYTRQSEFCVGTSMANRHRPETEGLLGMLVNNVVLRAQTMPNASLHGLLSHVRELTFEAYENQDVPFQDVVQALNITRNLSINPLFQTMFNFHNSPLSVPEIPELKLKLQEALGNGTAKFDLGIVVIPASPQRLRLNPEWDKDALVMLWEYNTDLFEEATIWRMIGHYQQILLCMIANPQQRISEICLLTENDRRALAEWNQTGKDVPFDKCVHELFSLQACQTPELPALLYGQQTMAYSYLNKKANQMAHYLRKQGIHPEVRVGMCMERRPEMMVVMLGILKAGGAYVPLDVNYPAPRLQYMVQDAELKLLLTTQDVRERLTGITGDWICVDQLWDEIGQENDQDFESGVRPENLAYVIYTSGSTGRPKGVGVEHRSIVRLVKRTNYVELGEEDVFLQLAPVSFDAATFEIWGSLLNGCRLTVYPGEVPSLEDLGQVIEKSGATVLWLTAGLFHQMVDTQLGRLKGVRQLLAGGDVLSTAHVCRALAELEETCLINGYGPTENTTFSCCYRMKVADASQLDGTVPIGSPITNSQAYVMDEETGCNPMPIGIPGEMCVGGVGLARGYLNRPELTAERFVPNPFSESGGERLYRTGDRVRWRGDGTLEFLGRIDHQVKVRGYRIELGEIESIMLEHPDVMQAVVVLRKEGNGETFLAAYFVSRNEKVNGDMLHLFLQQKLPGYMVPTSYIELDELPLTSNGKVDRGALPDPKRDSESHRSPRNRQEELLCRIFAQVLSLERVSIDDDFFALGGHSLMAMRVVSQVRKAFGTNISIRTIFDAPTVLQLGRYLASDPHAPVPVVIYANPSTIKRVKDVGHIEVAAKFGEEAVDTQTGEPVWWNGNGWSYTSPGNFATQLPPLLRLQPRPSHLPLSFAQQRLWFLAQMEGAGEAYHIRLRLHLKGKLDRVALRRALNQLVKRHEVLRTRRRRRAGLQCGSRM